MTDPLYPQDGSYYELPTEPPGQKAERNKEKGRTLAALPFIEECLTMLEDRISYYNSVDSIAADKRNTPEQFQMHYEANLQTRDDLTVFKEWIEQRRDAHKN